LEEGWQPIRKRLSEPAKQRQMDTELRKRQTKDVLLTVFKQLPLVHGDTTLRLAVDKDVDAARTLVLRGIEGLVDYAKML